MSNPEMQQILDLLIKLGKSQEELQAKVRTLPKSPRPRAYDQSADLLLSSGGCSQPQSIRQEFHSSPRWSLPPDCTVKPHI